MKLWLLIFFITIGIGSGAYSLPLCGDVLRTPIGSSANEASATQFIAQINDLKRNFSIGAINQFRKMLDSTHRAEKFYELVAKLVRLEIEKKARYLTQELVLENSTVTEQDLVIIGDGPHAIIAAINARIANPKLKILLVSNSSTVGGSYARAGEFYRLNSEEKKDGSSHQIPGGPFKLLDIAAPGYLMASKIMDLLTLNLAATADIVFNHSVDAVETITGTEELFVHLNSGVKIRTKALIRALGLGTSPNFGLGLDAKTNQLFAEYDQLAIENKDPQKVIPIEHYSRLASRVTKLIRSGQKSSFLTPYIGKRVAVIGAGGAGGTVIESLTGFGSAKLYGFSFAGGFGKRYGPGIGVKNSSGQWLGVRSVDWWGQKFTSPEGFRGNSNRRFEKTIGRDDVFNTITRVPGFASRVEKITLDNKTVFRLFTADGWFQDYDLLILTTAYSNEVIEAVHDGQKLQSDSNRPILNFGGIPVGTSNNAAYPWQDINVGPGAGQIVGDDIFMRSPTKTWTSIDVLGNRTALAARKVAERIGKR